MVSRQPASDTSAVGPISPSVPALLKAMSRPPKRSAASLHQRGGDGFVRHVACDRHRLAAGLFDLRDQRVELGLAAAADDDAARLPVRTAWPSHGRCRSWRR